MSWLPRAKLADRAVGRTISKVDAPQSLTMVRNPQFQTVKDAGASEVHLRPAEPEHFGATPPPGDEHELHRVGEVRGQMPADRRDLLEVGEALTRVVLG